MATVTVYRTMWTLSLDDLSESKDTDGDGVGDNADIVASVSNDIIYASAGALLLVLAGLLIGFLRSNRSPSDEPDAWGDEDRLNEAMFGSTASSDYSKEAVELPSMVDSGPPMGAAPSNLDLPNEPYQGGEMMTDLLAPLSDVQQPPAELMGMVLDGVETVEYPTGSGTVWTRSTPDADWQPKA